MITDHFSHHEEILKEKQAAAFLGFQRKTLMYWRLQKKGPPFLKIGKNIRYRKSDLLKWISEKLVNTVSRRK